MVAYWILVSPQSQLDLDFNLTGLGLGLGLRGPDLGLGFDNIWNVKQRMGCNQFNLNLNIRYAEHDF